MPPFFLGNIAENTWSNAAWLFANAQMMHFADVVNHGSPINCMIWASALMRRAELLRRDSQQNKPGQSQVKFRSRRAGSIGISHHYNRGYNRI